MLNESSPLDVIGDGDEAADVDGDDDADTFEAVAAAAVAFAVGGKVGSTLPRTDFVLWLNIILTFSHLEIPMNVTVPKNMNRKKWG